MALAGIALLSAGPFLISLYPDIAEQWLLFLRIGEWVGYGSLLFAIAQGPGKS